MCEISGHRFHRDFFISRCRRPHTEHDRRELEKDQRAPGMALASRVVLTLDGCRASVLYHFPPEIPVPVRLVVKTGLLQRTEEIEHHGDAAFGSRGIRIDREKIPPSFLRRQDAGKHTEYLAVLGKLRSSRTVGEHAVGIHALSADRFCDFVGFLPVSGTLFCVTEILHEICGCPKA